MTSTAPQGEFVDAKPPAPAPVKAAEKPPERAADKADGKDPTDPHWRASSFDLMHGLEVHDQGDDTIPGDLFDELFKK